MVNCGGIDNRTHSFFRSMLGPLAVVQGLVGGRYEDLSAMTMAFPAGPWRVNMVWDFGNPAHCLLDDLAFACLFHSLRPRG